MAKISERPITVREQWNLPLGFYWKQEYYSIAKILDCWKDVGRWWEGESSKTFYRVACHRGGVFEIYHEPEASRWFIYKIYD